MKKLIPCLLVVSIIGAAIPLISFRADAAGVWQQGISISPRWNTDFSSDSFKQSLRDIAATHANTVTLIIPWRQQNIYATSFYQAPNTPTDSSVADAIQYAHSLGLRVMLKVHVDPDGDWRAYINPSDKTTWFANYTNLILKYADIAKANNAEAYCIGTELISMTSPQVDSANTQRWLDLIAAIRSRYAGSLTYSANWGGSDFLSEEDHIQFWSALNYIGISAYFPVNPDMYANGVDRLMGDWGTINTNRIQPLANRWQKPVIFTEIGYRNITGAHTHPWDPNYGWNPDETEQANDYEALIRYWKNSSTVQGVMLWDFSSDPNTGGPSDTTYTIQHKQAQTVVTQQFGGTVTTPPPPPSGTYTGSASFNPAQPSPNQQTTATVSVKNTGTTATSDAVIDAEIYNASGQRVDQHFVEHQQIAANQTVSFAYPWTPSAAGTYTVSIGVFSSGWQQALWWKNGAATISVGGGTPTPTPTAGIEVWWPTNGATVSGVQPFKAMMPGYDVSAYQMYWRVDGGQLNEMYTSTQDYPHKEAIVDLSGWSWRGNGPYHLTFMTNLAQKSIDISVAH